MEIAARPRTVERPSTPTRTSARPVGSFGGSMIRTIDRGSLLDHRGHDPAVNGSSARVRTATPLGPFGRYGRASSDHAVPAMSRCAHGRPPVNSLRNIAAVIEPAGRPPVFDHVGDVALQLLRVVVEERHRPDAVAGAVGHAPHLLDPRVRRAEDAARHLSQRDDDGAGERRDVDQVRRARACARTTGRRRESGGPRRRC